MKYELMQLKNRRERVRKAAHAQKAARARKLALAHRMYELLIAVLARDACQRTDLETIQIPKTLVEEMRAIVTKVRKAQEGGGA